jgi:hypothetical protein
MAWGPEKRAGFALAALLSDDRELKAAGPALEPELRQSLASELANASARRAEAIAGWLALLRPELDETALGLPPRARALLAPLAKPPLRQALLAGGTAPQPHYSADRALLAALLRIARKMARGSAR